MSKNYVNIFLVIVIITLIAGNIYYFREGLSKITLPIADRVSVAFSRQIESFLPCRQPIHYSLGSIDNRFNLSNDEIKDLLSRAAVVWSDSLNRQLFAYSTSGELRINFVYDYRQEAADKLKKLGIEVGNDRQSYENLKAKYEAFKQQYVLKKVMVQSMAIDFEKIQNDYNAQVSDWNKRGGAPADEFKRLEQVKADLEVQAAQINDLTAEVNKIVDQLNAMATSLNVLIAKLNLNVGQYNNIGSQTGKEFEAGMYVLNPTSTSIFIYEFGNKEQLVRLLAHELGHALGIGHTTGTEDIMYYLNESTSTKPTLNDRAVLKAACNIK